MVAYKVEEIKRRAEHADVRFKVGVWWGGREEREKGLSTYTEDSIISALLTIEEEISLSVPDQN